MAFALRSGINELSLSAAKAASIRIFALRNTVAHASSNMEFEPPARQCIVCDGAIGRWGSKASNGTVFSYDRCRECGFVFVNPRPTLDALRLFYERFDIDSIEGDGSMLGQSRSTRVPRPRWGHRRAVRRLLALRSGPGRILDVGSGFGGVVAAALEKGLQPTALETNAELLDATRRLGPGVTCVPGLFEQFHAPAESFDYIIMSHVLEHVHDPLAFLTKADALLSPGGVLWIDLPNFDGIYRRLAGTRDPFFWPPGHLNHFNRRSLPLLCRRVGLQVVRVKDWYSAPINVLSKRLGSRTRVLAPVVQAGTLLAVGVAKVLAKVTRSGVVLSVVAVKPPPANRPF
jgi:SAM-dependent methyltransferase